MASQILISFVLIKGFISYFKLLVLVFIINFLAKKYLVLVIKTKFADVGMVVREVWWMGGECLFQGTGRCGAWIVDDLCLFS